jgi:hypothetical protein
MSRILFRADALPSIGTGDLVSLVALAELFRERDHAALFMVRDSRASRAILEKRGVRDVIWLDPDLSVADEVATLNTAVPDNHVDAVFLEITATPWPAYAGVRSDVVRCGATFTPGLPPGFDLGLCWDPDASANFPGPAYADMTLCLGPEFVILPREILDLELRQSWPETTRRVLVAMGGGDEADLTGEVLAQLEATGLDLDVTLVAGGGYQHLERLQRAVAHSVLSVRVKQNLPSLLPEYLACDVAIGAGGLTASELVATRTPALLVAAYEHQLQRCQFFDDQGWARLLGTAFDGSNWQLTAADLGFRPTGRPFTPRIREVVTAVEGLIRQRG